MLDLIYTEINVIGIALLLIMYYNSGPRRRTQQSFDQKLFSLMILSNIAILVVDTAMWLLNNTSFTGARELNYVFASVYYLSQPVICMLCLMYCSYKLKVDRKRLIKNLPIYLIPVVITAILVVFNRRTGWVFIIDENNVYHRGSLFVVVAFIAFVYFAIAFRLVLKETYGKKDRESIALRRPLSFFILTPFIGAVIQSAVYGLSLIWICCTFSILIIFINLQNSKITTDTLTGLNNRLTFEVYIEDKIKAVSKGTSLVFVMMDVDNFKHINDNYGHLVGDDALRQIADILIQSAEGNDFLARLGGDEFIIVGERVNPEEIKKTLEKIDENTALFNKQSVTEYKISLSKGVAVLNQDGATTVTKLIAAADDMMYKEKQLKKRIQFGINSEEQMC